jgi:hypothetical protein
LLSVSFLLLLFFLPSLSLLVLLLLFIGVLLGCSDFIGLLASTLFDGIPIVIVVIIVVIIIAVEVEAEVAVVTVTVIQ